MSPVLRIAVLAIAAWAVLVGLAWVFQRSLIYLPMTGAPPPARTVLEGAEEVAYETADGISLAGWLVRPGGPASGTTILVFNGNAGSRALRAPLARALARAGHTVLLTDYRGYGGNPGRPSEEGLFEDARAARAFLVDREGVDPGRLVYYGESLGSAVAVRLAEAHPPAALVLRSPFPSLVAVGRKHYPLLPVGLLLRDRFSCSERIARIGSPLLVLAGEEDSIIPVRYSRALFDAAREPKRLVVIDGADHNDYELLAGERLVSEVLRHVEADADSAPRREGPEPATSGPPS